MVGQTERLPIEGRMLNAVSFVMDYVELHFDGPKIGAFVGPRVVGPGPEEDCTFPEPGSRDALCALIGLEVTAAWVDDEKLQVTLGTRARVEIALDSSSRRSDEAATFVPVNERGEYRIENQIWW